MLCAFAHPLARRVQCPYPAATGHRSPPGGSLPHGGDRWTSFPGRTRAQGPGARWVERSVDHGRRGVADMAAGQARTRGRPGAPGARIAVTALVGTIVAVLGALVGAALPAVAAPAAQVDVDTNPTGAHVELGHDLSWVEVGPVPGRGHGGAGCHRRWVPADILVTPTPGGVGDAPSFVGVAPTPDAKPYDVYCDDTYVTMIWV